VGTQIASSEESSESSSSESSDSDKSSDEEKTKKSKNIPIKGKKVRMRDFRRANIQIKQEDRPSSATSNMSVTSSKTVVARPVKNG
jgi:hypothetical protein